VASMHGCVPYMSAKGRANTPEPTVQFRMLNATKKNKFNNAQEEEKRDKVTHDVRCFCSAQCMKLISPPCCVLHPMTRINSALRDLFCVEVDITFPVFIFFP